MRRPILDGHWNSSQTVADTAKHCIAVMFAINVYVRTPIASTRMCDLNVTTIRKIAIYVMRRRRQIHLSPILWVTKQQKSNGLPTENDALGSNFPKLRTVSKLVELL